jgi:hypothetical protein
MATINAINSENPIEVAKGGLGVASNTSFAVLCGGITATDPIQSIASVGSATQVLTSNGAGTLPTFQTAPTTEVSFQVVGSDPASPTNSQVWYRSDTNVFRGRANGVNVTFTVT